MKAKAPDPLEFTLSSPQPHSAFSPLLLFSLEALPEVQVFMEGAEAYFVPHSFWLWTPAGAEVGQWVILSFPVLSRGDIPAYHPRSGTEHLPLMSSRKHHRRHWSFGELVRRITFHCHTKEKSKSMLDFPKMSQNVLLPFLQLHLWSLSTCGSATSLVYWSLVNHDFQVILPNFEQYIKIFS